MSLSSALLRASSLILRQRREAIELFGVEKRNSYDILSDENTLIGVANETRQGFWGAVQRQVLKHWRTFHIEVLDAEGVKVFDINHPFRFYFHRLDITDASGATVGSMERQFSILSKKFKLQVGQIKRELTMESGLFKVWTFPFFKDGKQVAAVHKKWGGALKEIFLDADTFQIDLSNPALSLEERSIILSAALFIDLIYFEENQGGSLLDAVNLSS